MPDSTVPDSTVPGRRVVALHARAVLDVDSGDLIDSGYVRIEGNRIAEVGTDARTAAGADEVIDLPDLTLIPGLMDMEVDLVLGGPGAGLNDPVTVDPVTMTLRGAANARRTLMAGFTTVRNLGLFVKTERLPARRRAGAGDRRRLDRGLSDRSCRTRHRADRRAPRPRARRATSRRT